MDWNSQHFFFQDHFSYVHENANTKSQKIIAFGQVLTISFFFFKICFIVNKESVRMR